MTAGNAAQTYYRAFSPEWSSWLGRMPGIHDKIDQARTARLHQMPNDLDFLRTSAQLKEIDAGSRREYCEWEFTDRIRKAGIGLLIPDVQGFRTFGNLLAVRARLEMAHKQYDRAVYSFQTSLALGRNIANAPVLINALVGMAIAHITLDQVQTFMQIPDSPNLYRALAYLPRPFIDMHRPIAGERLWLYADMPVAR